MVQAVRGLNFSRLHLNFARFRLPRRARARRVKFVQSRLPGFYRRNIPGMAPPILPIILDILPIFFIIVCI